VADRSVTVPMIFSDFERRNATGHIFQANLLNNDRTVRPRTTQVDRITHLGRRAFLECQLWWWWWWWWRWWWCIPYRKEAGPKRNPI